jgi:hypothetical protein
MPSLKISKTGKSVSSTDPRDFIYSTDFQYLIEQQSGFADTDNNGNVTITHGLGYVPAFIIFEALYTNLGVWSANSVTQVYATSTQLVVNGASDMNKSKIFYVIFASQL